MAKAMYGAVFFWFILMAAASISWCYSAEIFDNSGRLQSLQDTDDLNGVMEYLAKQYMVTNAEKRGIDLGLRRGFSGSQAAKHLMGLAAANFANGPGRKRRDTSED